MTTLLYIANIIIILLLAFYLVYLISDRRYGLLRSLIARLFGHRDGLIWYWQNPLYLVRIIFITVLLLINITLIGQLMNSTLFNRTVWLINLSPLAWLMVLLSTYLSEHKNKKLAK